MSFIDLARSRRSIRSYLDKEVSEGDVKLLLEAASFAPSAGNLQSRAVIVVRDKTIKERLSDAALSQKSVSEASVVFVFCVNYTRASTYGERGERLYCIQDAAASTQNLLLMACEIGLGSCWVGAFDEQRVRGILSLPDHIKPVALIPVGYPKEIPQMPKRKEDVHQDKW